LRRTKFMRSGTIGHAIGCLDSRLPAVFKRRLSRIAKGPSARCSKHALARIAKGETMNPLSGNGGGFRF
jgi:hypothetical protein